jgi:hypothetical protein
VFRLISNMVSLFAAAIISFFSRRVSVKCHVVLHEFLRVKRGHMFSYLHTAECLPSKPLKAVIYTSCGDMFYCI